MTSRLRAGQLFALTIGLLVIFAAVGFVIANQALDRLGVSRRVLADRIDPALVAAQRLLIAMVDQETAVRGFSLSNDETLLAPYRIGSRRAPMELTALNRLTRRRQETRDLEAAAEAWRGGYAEPTIEAVRAGQRRFSEGEIERGRRLFDRVRARVARLSEALGAERNVAREELRHSATTVRNVVLAVTLAIFVAVVAAAWVLRRTVVAPLGRLAGEVGGIVEGNFDKRVAGSGAREVVELGSDVDAMRERIVAERDELKRSNAELEQFAYVASHDLQEPLRKVASFTQMLQRRYEGQLDERADTYIDFAVDGAKRMQELINDLLAFSRVGRITEEQIEVDTGELVRRALADLDTASATVEIGELPVVCGEERLLEVVFQNLLSNAFKFRGEEPLRVSVEAEHRDGEWCFTVADNGIGIEPEYADRIFVIFQRLHTRSAYQGTGIGLSMCRKIVEYHGGRMWLDTEAEPGATFHFTLPEVT
jgi:signal transduction histidine kinase